MEEKILIKNDKCEEKEFDIIFTFESNETGKKYVTYTDYTKDYKGITLKNLVKLSNCFEITIEDLVNGDITSLSFTTENYTESELRAIKDFSDYIKRSRDNE